MVRQEHDGSLLLGRQPKKDTAVAAMPVPPPSSLALRDGAGRQLATVTAGDCPEAASQCVRWRSVRALALSGHTQAEAIAAARALIDKGAEGSVLRQAQVEAGACAAALDDKQQAMAQGKAPTVAVVPSRLSLQAVVPPGVPSRSYSLHFSAMPLEDDDSDAGVGWRLFVAPPPVSTGSPLSPTPSVHGHSTYRQVRRTKTPRHRPQSIFRSRSCCAGATTNLKTGRARRRRRSGLAARRWSAAATR